MDKIAFLYIFVVSFIFLIYILNIMIRKKDGFIGERAFVLPPACIAEMENHPIGSQLHITDIGYYPSAGNHYRHRVEPIMQWVLIYCRAGKGWYEIDDRHYEVGPNHYFILPAGRPHSYGADKSDPWTIYWVHYRGAIAHTFMPPSAGPVAVKPGPNSRIADRIALFEEIMTTLERGYSRESLTYTCATMIYFLSTLRHIDSFRAAAISPDNGSDREKLGIVDSVIRLMTENIESSLRLTDMASYAGVTPSYLSHLFTAHTGHSPINHLRLLRIRQACQLLDFTSLHVNQICHKVGISDPYYFSRLFTSVMGVSPTEYRKRLKG